LAAQPAQEDNVVSRICFPEVGRGMGFSFPQHYAYGQDRIPAPEIHNIIAPRVAKDARMKRVESRRSRTAQWYNFPI
jgi:hypothetical protein